MEGRCEEGCPSVLPPVLCRREGGRSYWREELHTASKHAGLTLALISQALPLLGEHFILLNTKQDNWKLVYTVTLNNNNLSFTLALALKLVCTFVAMTAHTLTL